MLLRDCSKQGEGLSDCNGVSHIIAPIPQETHKSGTKKCKWMVREMEKPSHSETPLSTKRKSCADVIDVAMELDQHDSKRQKPIIILSVEVAQQPRWDQ